MQAEKKKSVAVFLLSANMRKLICVRILPPTKQNFSFLVTGDQNFGNKGNGNFLSHQFEKYCMMKESDETMKNIFFMGRGGGFKSTMFRFHVKETKDTRFSSQYHFYTICDNSSSKTT